MKGCGLRRMVNEGGITDEEKITRKEGGEPGKASITLEAGKVSRREAWWSG